MKLFSKSITIFTVSLALFMDVLDSNIINTAIPAMSRSLAVNPVDLKIALISYLLSLAVFIPISGWTADQYGAKRIFIAALGLFTLSSFWCGYASTLPQLVVARCVQGIGGAFMISLGRLIIARTFKQHEFVEAMNAVIIVVSMAVMLGPLVGGIITDHLSWPWIFWVNIPAGLLAILLASLSFKDTAARKKSPFDFIGFILFGGGLALLCFSLSDLSETTANRPVIFWMMLSACLMLRLFVFHAKQKPHPLIKLELFRIRTFQVSVCGNLCARLGFGGTPFLLPLLQQLCLGFNAELSGLLLTPIAFGILFSKFFALGLLRRLGYKRFLLSNTILVGLVLWTFQLITLHTSVYFIACLTFLFGVGISAQFTGMNSLAFADLKEEQLSASTSITSTVQTLSQSLGVAVAAILLSYYSGALKQSELTPEVFHHTFFTMGMLTFLSTLIFMRLKAGDGKQMLQTAPPDLKTLPAA
jgi:EmrB/QacA subfamily drug resistance transporter